jgi:hypothetical protein
MKILIGCIIRRPASDLSSFAQDIELARISQGVSGRLHNLPAIGQARLRSQPLRRSTARGHGVCSISTGCSHLARRLSGPALVCVRECAHLLKAEQPRNL